MAAMPGGMLRRRGVGLSALNLANVRKGEGLPVGRAEEGRDGALVYRCTSGCQVREQQQ